MATWCRSVASGGRDPSIGAEWLAWYAMARGDEAPERLAEYFEAIEPRLGKFIADNRQQMARYDEEMLSGLHLVLIGLRIASRMRPEFDMKLTLERRRAGKPIDRNARAKLGHSAAAIVERQVAAGVKQESAIADASSETGLSRSEIFKWLRHDRNWRDPEWRAAFVAKLSRQKED